MNFLLYQLYLLHLENYEIRRYFRILARKGYFVSKVPLRKRKINWTKKISAIFSFAIIATIVGFILFLKISIVLAVIWFVIALLIFPLFYIIGLLIMLPFDLLAKAMIMNKAKNLVAKNQKIKIIGIAGSYGKTTMKNVLAKILAEKFSVEPTPGNVNTPVGTASWYLKNNKENTDYLLIEFGEEYPRDNEKIARIFPLNIVIITGINEAHFERFKNIEITAKTIFEAVTFSKPDANIFLNSDDKNILDYQHKFVGDKKVTLYGRKNINNAKFDDDKLCWDAEITGFGKVSSPILGKYILSDIDAAVKIGKSLGLTDDEIKKGLAKITPIKHRLEPIAGANGVLVIDDTYNGNPEGIKEAVDLLALFKTKRKIFLTPGMVEAGSRSVEIHKAIGEQLAGVADLVLLIKTSSTSDILEGLKSKKFPEEKIIWFETAQEAHESLKNILKKDDVILFQNDWPDLYL